MRKQSFRLKGAVLSILTVFAAMTGGCGPSTHNFRIPASPAGVKSSAVLHRRPISPYFDTRTTHLAVEPNYAQRQADRHWRERDVTGDQITYGYLHGFVLATIFGLAGASFNRRGALIGGGFGMALGSSGAVYAIGEGHTDFDRDNLFELPLFRVVDGGTLGLATFGGSLLGVGVFSPITATIAYHQFKPKKPAVVSIEAGQIDYSLPTIRLRASVLPKHRPEADLTVRVMQVRF
jgi:hypothetical protein